MVLPLYRIATAAARLAPLPRKARASVAGRQDAVTRWERWAASHPAGDAPTVWLHGASVGECLALEPIIHRLRVAHPGLRTTLTYVSPSSAEWASWPVDRADFLPLDRPDDVRRAFDALRPDVIVVSRCDIWPEWFREAGRRDVPLALVGATVREDSARLRWPVRTLYRSVLGGVRFAGALTDADAERLVALGVPHQAIAVTGDPAHDRVIERPTDFARLEPLRRWAERRFVIVAGSLEVGDVEPVARALGTLMRGNDRVGALVIAHDPDGAAAEAIPHALERAGIATARCAGTGDVPAASAIHLVGRGVLADAYLAADIAHVGGSKVGAHSVVEPAAFGVPVTVLASPRPGRDVETLRRGGGGAVLRGAEALASQWRRWLTDDAVRTRAGLAARAALDAGAATHCVRALLALLPAYDSSH